MAARYHGIIYLEALYRAIVWIFRYNWFAILFAEFPLIYVHGDSYYFIVIKWGVFVYDRKHIIISEISQLVRPVLAAKAPPMTIICRRYIFVILNDISDPSILMV